MKYTLMLLERRAQRVVEEMAGQAMITSMPNDEDYVTIDIEISSSTDVLSLFHAGKTCGLDIVNECRAEIKTF